MNWKPILIVTTSLILVSQVRADPPTPPGAACKTSRPGLLKKFDANGDGKLDDTEKAAMKKAWAEHHAEMLKKFDANGDGKLDDTERAALKKDRATHWIEQHPKLVKKFDANGDGKLDDKELVALRKFRDERRAERQKSHQANGDDTAKCSHRRDGQGHHPLPAERRTTTPPDSKAATPTGEGNNPGAGTSRDTRTNSSI